MLRLVTELGCRKEFLVSNRPFQLFAGGYRSRCATCGCKLRWWRGWRSWWRSFCVSGLKNNIEHPKKSLRAWLSKANPQDSSLELPKHQRKNLPKKTLKSSGNWNCGCSGHQWQACCHVPSYWLLKVFSGKTFVGAYGVVKFRSKPLKFQNALDCVRTLLYEMWVFTSEITSCIKGVVRAFGPYFSDYLAFLWSIIKD